MSRWLRHVLLAVGVFLALAGFGLWSAYRATKAVPEFYEQALQGTPHEQQAQGHALERNLAELQNEVQRPGRWEATFTDAQINGWLAYDLPRSFSDMLPAGVSEPRVRVTTNQAQIACRYESSQVDTVVSLAVSVHLTEEPNVLAVRIQQARAGLLPLPLKSFLDRIATAAQRGNLELRWAQESGDPVALVRIPEEYEGYERKLLRMETVELRDGELYLAGHTERPLAAAPLAAAALADAPLADADQHSRAAGYSGVQSNLQR